ncbi:MAG: hypothetical protein SF053_00010 [Bacteroidia bacterium]|jgi:hypothetical protein|nr:hypothetical protein [Bacteroidia bacterium]
MRHFIFTLLMTAGLGVTTYAQATLDRQVLSTAGQYTVNGTFSLSYTIGEPIVTTAITLNGTVILTQGFQQPEGGTVGLDKPLELLVDYSLSPNPTPGPIQVNLATDRPLSLVLAVFDAQGRATSVPEQRVRVLSNAEVRMDLSLLADGYYFIGLLDTDHNLRGAISVQKTH